MLLGTRFHLLPHCIVFIADDENEENIIWSQTTIKIDIEEKYMYMYITIAIKC